MKGPLPGFAPHVPAYERVWYYVLRAGTILTLAFLILPILVIIPLSFSDGSFLAYPIRGYSMRWYAHLFASDDWMATIRSSLIVAPFATLVATVLGTLAALGLTRGEFAGKAVVMAFLISPMIVPVIVVGVGMYLFFVTIHLSDSYLGLILGHAALGAPFVVITVVATLQGFNQNLVRASQSLGASPTLTFFKITLPLIGPGVVSGALFAFATSFDDVVLAMFLAGPQQRTLPMAMFSGLRDNITPTIAAIATILTLFSVCLLLTVEWLRGRSDRQRHAA